MQRWALNQTATEIGITSTTPCQYLEESSHLSFKRLIGEGIARTLQEDYANAKGILKHAETFVMLRNQEKSRFWYLTASALSGIAIALIAFSMWIFRSPLIELVGVKAFYASLAGAIGGMGATLSIIMRMGKLHLDCLSGKTLHYMEGTSRVAAGGLSGTLVYLAIESGQFLPMLLNTSGGHAAILFAAMAAGASERWAPSIVSKFEGVAQRSNEKQRS